jgi:Calcineurin-like phosphoesterase
MRSGPFRRGPGRPIYKIMMRLFDRRALASAALAAVLSLGAPSAGAAEQSVWTGVDRIVAVGDLHGDYDGFRAILASAGLIDAKGRWIGGKTHLVQIGDVPDRGPGTTAIIDDLRKLEKQARKAGGYVHTLMGNHEAMNIVGDYRYVSDGEYEHFVARGSERTRDQYFDRYVADVKQRTPEKDWPVFDAAYREDWNSKFPLGYVEHGRAWSLQGEYGKWAAKNPVIIEIDGTLFLHGGLSAKYAAQDIAAINKAVHDEISTVPPVTNGVAFDEDGPLWFRGLALGSEATEEPAVQTALAHDGARRIVIAHTPTIGPILPRFGGRVILADTGISAYYGGNRAYLLIEGDDVFAGYGDAKIPLPGRSAQNVLAYLKTVRPLMKDPKTVDALIMQIETPAAGH